MPASKTRLGTTGKTEVRQTSVDRAGVLDKPLTGAQNAPRSSPDPA
jgi:hypothetical protein